MIYFNFLISYVFDISCVKMLSMEKRETEEQRRVTPEVVKSGANLEIMTELEESVFAPETLYKGVYLVSIH